MSKRKSSAGRSKQSLIDGLELRRMLCGIPHDRIPEAPKFDWAIEAAETAESGPEATNITWTNRANTTAAGVTDTDGFGAIFGTSAPAARVVVDAVLNYWERIITNWNRADATTTLQVTISMDTGFNFGAAAAPAASAPADGKPRSGSIVIGRGTNDGVSNNSNGWFFDPTPNDNSEFQGTILNAFAGVDSDGVGPDLFSVVSAELVHVMGLITDRNDAGGSYNGYLLDTTPFVSATGIRDNAEGGGSFGFFYTFDGPTIDHLFTSYNSGDPTSGSWGNIVHSAGVGTPINFGGKTWVGSQDSGNASYGNERTLPSHVMTYVFKDVYNYTVVDPAQFGTFYAVLDQTTNTVNVRGGAGASADKIYISQDGADIVISVDLGDDVAGSWNLSNDGDYPAWTTRIASSEVSSIVVNAGDGNDSIYIYSSASGDNITVNADAGNDFIQFGNGDIDSEVFGNVTVNGGAGTDAISYFDLLDDVGNDTYTITSSTIKKVSGGTLTYGTTVEELDVSGNGLDNTFDVNSSSVTTVLNLLGFGGNDTFLIDVDFDTFIDGTVSCSGGAGTDIVIVDDSADALDDEYLFTSNRFQKETFGDGVVYASSSTESFDVTLNPGSNLINIPQIVSTLDVTIRGGDGSDNFTIGNGNLTANLLSSLSVVGGAGTDSVLLNDTSDTGDDDYTVTSNTAGKTGALVGYSQFEEFRLTCNGGANEVVINSTTVMDYNIAGNGGNDDFVINDGTSFLFNIGGQITLQGNAGDDDVIIRDDAFAGTGNYTITNTSIALPFNSSNVAYASMESLSVTGSNGVNTINVNSASIFTLASGADGDDVINVGGGDFDTNITANVFVLGGNGVDVVNLQDTADASNATFNVTSGSTGKSTTAALLQYNFFGPTIDNIQINAGAGSSLFNIESIGSSTSAMNLTVNAGPGNDTFGVATASSNLSSSLYGTVVLDGEGDADVVDLYDGADAGADIYNVAVNLTFNQLTKTGLLRNVQYRAENTQLNINPDANTVSVTGHLNNLTVSDNGGADTFNITNATGVVTVRGGPGLDNVNVNTDNVGTVIVRTDANEDWASLNIGTGGRLNNLSATIFSDSTSINGVMDLGQSGKFIHSGPQLVGGFDQLLRKGYNGGAWNGTQPAIVSSFAAGAASTKDAVGFARAGDVGVGSFGGFAVSAGDLIFGRTQYSDTDLDADVDFADLLRVSQNYGLTGKYWWQGSFDYDAPGEVTFADLLAMAQNYGTPLSTSEMQRAGVPSSLARSVSAELRQVSRRRVDGFFSDDAIG
jgi:hypothetical protein